MNKKTVWWASSALVLIICVVIASVFWFNLPKNKKISVILPIYNVAEYLPECLDSLINQTHKNLEIICVNDGSSDNSLEVLRGYKKKDNRIKVIDQKNAGVSAARNAGIEASTSEYITFVDPDDFVDKDTYRLAINKMFETGADIVSFGFTHYPEGSRENFNFYDREFKDEPIAAMERVSQFNYVWCKLYKKSLIIDNQIYFLKGLNYLEDELFVEMLYPKANKIVTMKEKLYYYRQRENSLGHSINYEKEWNSVVARSRVLIENWHNNKYNKQMWLFNKYVGHGWRLEGLDSLEKKIKYASALLEPMEKYLLPYIDESAISKYDGQALVKLRHYANMQDLIK